MARLPVSQYEPLLKEDLNCWRCHTSLKNIPALKVHLQEEWDKEKRKTTVQKKRKREEFAAASVKGDTAEEDPDSSRQTKRLETSENGTSSHT